MTNAKTDTRNDIGRFLLKILLLSALLSLVIKYGGPLLPIAAPFTERLNGSVWLIVLLPSVMIGLALLALNWRSP
jgi:hypothetical protein